MSLSCRACCRDTPEGACVPYGSTLVSDGVPCPKGYCQAVSIFKCCEYLAKRINIIVCSSKLICTFHNIIVLDVY